MVVFSAAPSRGQPRKDAAAPTSAPAPTGAPDATSLRETTRDIMLHATHAIRRGAELSIDYGVDGWCKEEVVGRYGFAPSKGSPCTATKSTRDRKRKKKRRITPMLTPANVDKWVAGKA